jgi:small GTP-binding protein
MVLLGESAAGKTAILHYLLHREFSNPETTISGRPELYSTEVDSNRVEFQVWDTPGHERCRSMVPLYCHGAKAAIVVYEMSDP